MLLRHSCTIRNKVTSVSPVKRPRPYSLDNDEAKVREGKSIETVVQGKELVSILNSVCADQEVSQYAAGSRVSVLSPASSIRSE